MIVRRITVLPAFYDQIASYVKEYIDKAYEQSGHSIILDDIPTQIDSTLPFPIIARFYDSKNNILREIKMPADA